MNPAVIDNSLPNARALALLRIGVGVLFIIFGEYKVFGTQFTLHGGFQFWINRFLADGAFLGIWVRPSSFFGLLYMLTLLFSSNYPGAHAPFWQYFGASLDHSVLAFCFVAFLISRADALWSLGARRGAKQSIR
jgi:hypothetical protein